MFDSPGKCGKPRAGAHNPLCSSRIDASCSERTGGFAVVELLRNELQTLREDGEFVLYRSRAKGGLVLACVLEQPTIESLKRLEHEYALKADLETAWAARPVALSRQNDRVALLLEDPGGEPLDRLLGRPLEVSEFLRIAIPLAGALRQVHGRRPLHKDIKPANVLVDVANGGVHQVIRRLDVFVNKPSPMHLAQRTRERDCYSQEFRYFQWSAEQPIEWLAARILKQQCHALVLARQRDRPRRPGSFEIGFERIFVFEPLEAPDSGAFQDAC